MIVPKDNIYVGLDASALTIILQKFPRDATMYGTQSRICYGMQSLKSDRRALDVIANRNIIV